jgi:TonB family protein
MLHVRRGATLALFLAAAMAASADTPTAAPAAPAAVAPAAAPATAPAASDELSSAGIAEFLDWAHPAEGGCAPVEHIAILARWPGGMRVAFEVPCADARQSLQAILETRVGQGVWQVAAAFEAGAEDVEAAIRSRVLRLPPHSDQRNADGRHADARHAAPEEMKPPPANPGEEDASPLRALTPPMVTRKTGPILPEEAGRARLIGEARVELLVDVSSQGRPDRARPLRGPNPDLGMRQAATQAIRGWQFNPAVLAGRPVRYFAPITIVFEGLPPESRFWTHRALFDLEALVYDREDQAEAAARRLRAGEPIEEVAPDRALDSEWGLSGAADLPAPLRKALHETMIGLWAGPVEADGSYYLARKRGEVYYAILPAVGGGGTQYRIVYQRGIPGGDELRSAIDEDIVEELAARQRRDYMNEAARLMGIRQDRVEIGQLVIHTDVLDADEMKVLGQVVNAALRAHQDFWAGLTTLRLFREQVDVYAFGRRADHQAVQQIWGGRRTPDSVLTLGEYIPASRILAFPCGPTAGHLPIPIAIHESIHMLNYERVYPAGVRPSRWFEEGLANYFGYSQITSQLRIDPGDIRRSGTITVGKVSVQFDPRTELLEHLKLSRDEGPLPLHTLIEAGPDDPIWSGGRAARAYGAAWTLVHFLIHGDHGRHAGAFRQYAGREARGEGGPAAFSELLGPDLNALEAAWHAYEETL